MSPSRTATVAIFAIVLVALGYQTVRAQFGVPAASPGMTQSQMTSFVNGNVQATNVVTDAGGNWSVTWSNPFASSTPIVSARAVNSSGNNPIACETATRSSTAATGWCRQNNPALLNLSIVTSGLTLNAFGATPATNTPVMVIGREPTQ